MTTTPDLAAAYEQYAPALHRYIAYRIGDGDAADDLLADVFSRALEDLPRYEERGHPISAWLYRIAHDRAVDHLRRQGRRPVVSLDVDAAVADELEDRILDQQEGQAVWAFAAHLTPKQRQVLELRFQRDLSIAEVAGLLQTTEGAVKALQVRGLATLRQVISPSMPAAACDTESPKPDPLGLPLPCPSPLPTMHEAFTADLCQILDGLITLLAGHIRQGGMVPDAVALRVVRLAECALRSPGGAADAPGA